ncbi:hypothetical protein R5R35_000135 [Gryllus longicercus]|uniref:Uncharacterized protein n=1 Tax=Gryllus longicercus TaxID=2509291 RepID=A0AAN9V519_9ORTH
MGVAFDQWLTRKQSSYTSK